MRKQWITVVARLGLSILPLVLVLMLIDRQALVNALSSIQLGLYFIGLALYLCSMTLWTVRWRLFITATGERVSFWRVGTTIMVGSFFALFLPTVVGNDLARMYQLSPEGGTNSRIVSTVLLDRVVGLISLVMMALVGLVISYQLVGNQDTRITLVIIGALVALGGGWLVFFNRSLMRHFRGVFKLPIVRRFEGGIRKLYDALYQLYLQPRLLASSLAVSFVMQMVEVTSIICIARALNIQVSALYFFIFVPMIWVVTMIPISISGIGLREGAFLFFFSQVGVTPSEAVALSVLYYAYRLILSLAGGFLFMRFSFAKYAQARANG